MLSGPQVIKRLRDTHRLTADDYKSLLIDDDLECFQLLQEEAREVSVSRFGRSIFIRGLIEIGNHCRNNCLYCGIRAGNKSLSRYRLEKEDILACCRQGHISGFRTFVLQGGEDPARTDGWVEDVVSSIHKEFPDCAITLSLGEMSAESYRRLRTAGADRYLLRHETFNPEHYSRLHPASMSRERRLECLRNLKEAGFQTGTGIMVGSPFQTVDNIVEDLLFIQDFCPEMIGIGPFIHHSATPFAGFPDGSVRMTLKLTSIFRLMHPRALIPATTALASLDSRARSEAILSGANVVMPNLSPVSVRRKYSLYDGKAASGAESVEGLEDLIKELSAIGYGIAVGRGDYKTGC